MRFQKRRNGRRSAIFAKTGVRSRGELVAQVFLEHYVSRWEDVRSSPPGWIAKEPAASATPPA